MAIGSQVDVRADLGRYLLPIVRRIAARNTAMLQVADAEKAKAISGIGIVHMADLSGRLEDGRHISDITAASLAKQRARIGGGAPPTGG